MNTRVQGSILRNTAYVYGVVLYVGKDTKIMRCVGVCASQPCPKNPRRVLVRT